MPVPPSDFLRALVLVVTERLQRGEDTTIPGVGTWTVETDQDSGRVSILFSEGTSEDPSVDQSLADQVGAEVGAPPAEVTSRIDGFARAVRSHLEETGSVLLPGIGRLTGRIGRIAFRPEPFFADAVDWDTPVVFMPEEKEEDQPPVSAQPEVPAFEGGAVDPDEGKEQPASRYAAPVAPPDQVDLSVPEPKEPPTPPPPPPARTAPVRPRRRVPVLPLAVGAIVVVVAVVAVVLTQGGRPPRPIDTVAAADTVTAGLTAAAPVDTTAAASSSTEVSTAMDSSLAAAEPEAAEPQVETVAPTPGTPIPPAEVPAAAPPGQDFDTSSPGYTLIVGSTVIEADALQGIQPYRELGLPAAVLAYVEDGSPRYRLAVGRYESAAVADQARQEMTGRLPAGTWVRRIRP